MSTDRWALVFAFACLCGCSKDAVIASSATGGSASPSAGSAGAPSTESRSGGAGASGGVATSASGGAGAAGSTAGAGSSAMGMSPARAGAASETPPLAAGASGSAQAGSAGVPAIAGGTGGASAPVAQACPATSALMPGDSTGTLEVGNMKRDYIVHVPKSYTGQTPVPLVTDWHGLLTDADFQKSLSGYLQKADKEGFIVVFPNALEAAWNVGHCCTRDKTIDDVAFARALVAKLQTQACIDPKRIYAVGFSLGGGMSIKLACDAADLFAAVAPAAFDLMIEEQWPCRPSRPITLIAFRGTADPIVPYDGGPTMPPNGLAITVTFLGAEANFMKWSQLNGCTGSPVMGTGRNCQTYTQCKDGVEVALCTTQGGSHDFGDPDIAWDMLNKHRLP